MQADGHEIGGHSVTHPDLTTLSPADLDYELRHSKEYLESVAGAGQVQNLATPYGTYNDAVIAKAKELQYASLRSTDEGFNSKEDFDQYRIEVQNMQKTTTQAEFQSWIDQAKKDNSWLVLVYHRVATSDLEQFDTPEANFRPQMQYLKNSGVTVLTTEQALQELLPQI
jgi:peptidoglycan/xylan/chitin deacetylase (PgdA/CDA1 family)